MQIYESGPRLDAPVGDPSREAVFALRGYAYQLYASGLAWLALEDAALLCIEMAEDYAVATKDALSGTQVRDTASSGRITLQSAWTRQAIDSFVDLAARNPQRTVYLHYLTTSAIGVERETIHRIGGGSALAYWRRAAAGADLTPLRSLILDLDLAEPTKTFLGSLSDERFRTDFLRRVHWQCGAPGLGEIRSELEAGLIEYAATCRRLPSQAARNLVPAVLAQILETAVSRDRRTLRRADLLKLIDEASLVSIPMERLTALLQGEATGHVVARDTVLSPVGDMPLPLIYAPRATLVAAVDDARRSCGLGIVVGATGLGKSMIARLVATTGEVAWWIADFRNLLPAEAAARLVRLKAELATSSSPHVILDDLNGIDQPIVRDGLSNLLASLRRRDGSAIVTTYRAPANTTLQQLTLETSSPVVVTYLDDDEVADLVVQAGGEAKYASPIRRAAADGHPQLTMAILLHLKAAGWSRKSLASVLGGRMQSELGDERRAVRERLISTLSDDAQTLVLRTSIVKGSFDRTLALRIAELAPGVARAGLVLDQLVGPWVEPYRRTRLRVSPLLEDAAKEVLPASECMAIHRLVAETLLGADLDARDAEAAMHHSLQSGDTLLVAAFAGCIVSCDLDMAEYLSPFLLDLAFLSTDVPIFPGNGAASATMRLAQLIVLLPFASGDQVRACWNRLELERHDMKGADLFEGIALSKLLLNLRSGTILDDWLEFLLRFDELCQTDPRLVADMRFGSGQGKAHVTGVLFAGQIRSIRTIRCFRDMLRRLDRESPSVRQRVLSSFRSDRADISVLVNHGWLCESRLDGFDWEAAQDDYRLAGELAVGWNDVCLASRCAVAQAMCIDENGRDPDRALACLDAWEARIGFDNALVRARAKILWRRRDHQAALPLLTAAAEGGKPDTIDSAHLAREAGISAAALGDWQAAVQWFERARKAAKASGTIASVRAMAVGLLADAAHAAEMSGSSGGAVTRLRDALVELADIDPDGTAAEAHCHRVVRHLVLWLYGQVTGTLRGEEIVYAPGAASNPEPNELIRDHPVMPVDMAFYLLADVDAALAQPTGFHVRFREYLLEGPVLSSEISAAIRDDARVIAEHDPTEFVRRVRRHASLSRLVHSGEARDLTSEMLNPVRGSIPLATIDDEVAPDLLEAAVDFLLSFATAAAMARAFDAIDSIVKQGLEDASVAALHPLLRRLGGAVEQPRSDREGAAGALWAVRKDLSGRPVEFCWCSMWLLVTVHNSRLRSNVAAPLIAWIFAGADQLIRHARFHLATPSLTVPPVEAIIQNPDRSFSSTARLLLALAPAVATSFVEPVRERLDRLATGAE